MQRIPSGRTDLARWAREAPEEYERTFNPRVAVPGFEEVARRRARANRQALETRRTIGSLAYGPGLRHRLDVYRPASSEPAPVHLYFHGGYWRSGDKENFAFLGASLADQGITTLVANYDLCPASSLDEVVASAHAAFRWTVLHASRLGGDPERITLSGHSAGAHLCAAILAAQPDHTIEDRYRIRGIVALSGAFDPTPALFARVNEEIGLTRDAAARQDMLTRPILSPCQVAVFAGGDEPPGWIDLSARYAAHADSAGCEATYEILPGYHHFDITDLYADAGGPILRAIRRQAGVD